jgi:hypothetical protein
MREYHSPVNNINMVRKPDENYTPKWQLNKIKNPKKPANKKYHFLEPVTSDDRNWPTEKRLAWAERSEQSLSKLQQKYSSGITRGPR